jgi:hypothetical protein
MTNREYTPLETRLIGAVSFGSGVCESFAINAMVHVAIATEAEYSKIGNGAPPFENLNEVWLRWHQVAEFATAEA